MSVIVAYKERDKIIVACDDRETVKNLYKDSYSRKSKDFVYYDKKEFIIYCAGNVAKADLLAPKIGQLTKIDETRTYFSSTISNKTFRFEINSKSDYYIKKIASRTNAKIKHSKISVQKSNMN